MNLILLLLTRLGRGYDVIIALSNVLVPNRAALLLDVPQLYPDYTVTPQVNTV